MDKATIQFLALLSSAMVTRQSLNDMEEADWDKLLHLASMHNIVPMIYEAAQHIVSFSQAPYEVSAVWRNRTISSSINQMYRTMEFLMIYDKLNQAGIQALVVKGIICRQLYPNNYYRSSSDEDVYILREDFEQVDRIFQASGLQRNRRKRGGSRLEQVTTYYSPNHGLCIELHIDLFPTESDLFEPMNQLFCNSFKESLCIMIDGISVHTLSHNAHLLFLILHSMKHFLATGFGIRQVCDMVMFINTYGKEIHWNTLWNQLLKLKYEVFFLNLLDIGMRYLGLNTNQIEYPKGYSSLDVHSDGLLYDIMKAGIFGKSAEQVKTSSITLHAIRKDRKKKGKNHPNGIIMNTLFPEHSYMSSHYAYCRKNCLLLPVAWMHRIVTNLAEDKSITKLIRKADNSFTIGRRRTQLLEEYKIIGRQ
ncbi:MAG: hypothetical protein K0R92_240 [Lachnospiraceae bacterium]|jgi:hypothetical protein|nr:hypothetical protein [Lachnospiraceae bacterium]